MKTPKLILLVDTPAEKCMERLQGRGRTAETGLPLEYLKMLEKGHVDMIRDLEYVVVNINGKWDSSRVGELGTLAINEFLGGASVQVCD